MTERPCVKCGHETKNKKACHECGTLVQYVPKVKAKRELEAPIKARIRLALVEAGALMWVHNVDNRMLHTGLGIGTSDLIGVVPPHGRFLGVEVKRPGEKPNDNQKRWLAVVRQFGGVSGVATNVQEALALLNEARQLSPMQNRHVESSET